MKGTPRKARTLVRIPVEFQGISEDVHIKGKGHTLDLNINGCRIESATAAPRGSYLRLRLTIPNAPKLITIGMARVRWVESKSFGVEFIQRSAEDIPLIAQVTAESDDRQNGVLHSIQQRAAKGGRTVLVVEDDPDLLHLCSKTLEAVGFKVLKASGSVEALQLVTGYLAPIHLLLVDLILRPSTFQLQDGKDRHPRVHGHEFVERALRLRKQAHVVYMTGHDDQALTALGIKTGGTLCMQKPFSREDLLAAIERALAGPPMNAEDLPKKSLKKAANDR